MTNAKTYGAAAAVAIMLGLGIAAWARGSTSTVAASAAAATTQPSSDPMMDARTKGSPDAPITVYEMSDFQCPFCLQFFEDTWPAFQEEYINTGKVKIVFVNLPLIQIHPNAAKAHEFAMCAAAQGEFWPTHDRLFATQATWAPMADPSPHFVTLAEAGGLDQIALNRCLASGIVRTVIGADVQAALRNRISSTPTFIVDGGVLQGAAPMTDWRPILDSIYTLKTGSQ